MSKQLAGAYTLIECLISMCVLIILMTLSVASYRYLITQNKRTVYQTALVSSLRMARAAALSGRMQVTICPSANGQQCGGLWREGWLIYRKHQLQSQSVLQIIKVHAALPRGDRLYWRAALAQEQPVQFNALGNAMQNGTFIYCPYHNQALAGAIILSLTGRSRVENVNFDKTICADER